MYNIIGFGGLFFSLLEPCVTHVEVIRVWSISIGNSIWKSIWNIRDDREIAICSFQGIRIQKDFQMLLAVNKG